MWVDVAHALRSCAGAAHPFYTLDAETVCLSAADFSLLLLCGGVVELRAALERIHYAPCAARCIPPSPELLGEVDQELYYDTILRIEAAVAGFDDEPSSDADEDSETVAALLVHCSGPVLASAASFLWLC